MGCELQVVPPLILYERLARAGKKWHRSWEKYMVVRNQRAVRPELPDLGKDKIAGEIELLNCTREIFDGGNKQAFLL
jgi:hypothetical protein